MGEAVKLYLDARTDLRDSMLKSYKYKLEGVCKPLHDVDLDDIQTRLTKKDALAILAIGPGGSKVCNIAAA